MNRSGGEAARAYTEPTVVPVAVVYALGYQPVTRVSSLVWNAASPPVVKEPLNVLFTPTLVSCPPMIR